MIKRWDEAGRFITAVDVENMKKEKIELFKFVSPGELFDKLSILQIKRDKGLAVEEEYNTLHNFLFEFFPSVSLLFDSLVLSNRTQWDLEDVIRSEKDMSVVGKTAVLIREYNDNRVNLKNKINRKLQMGFEEQKNYKRS
jgi:hypothetical protein